MKGSGSAALRTTGVMDDQKAASHTPSMIARVARAIVVGECVRRFRWIPSDAQIAEMLPAYMVIAKLAIKEMREPTNDMEEAAYRCCNYCEECKDSTAHPTQIWSAMIDAALKDES